MTETVSIEIKNEARQKLNLSRSTKSKFPDSPTCMYRVSFLVTLDIYKANFKGRYTWRTHAESDLVPYYLCKKLLRLLRLKVL